MPAGCGDVSAIDLPGQRPAELTAEGGTVSLKIAPGSFAGVQALMLR
jgi:hypothetical protein